MTERAPEDTPANGPLLSTTRAVLIYLVIHAAVVSSCGVTVAIDRSVIPWPDNFLMYSMMVLPLSSPFTLLFPFYAFSLLGRSTSVWSPFFLLGTIDTALCVLHFLFLLMAVQ